jgi:hypothetical protein
MQTSIGPSVREMPLAMKLILPFFALANLYAMGFFQGIWLVAPVALPGKQAVELGVGSYELQYQGYIRDCTAELRGQAVATDVVVTRLSDGRPVALEPIAAPQGRCNHGTWTGTLYRFEVTEAGRYEITAQPPAATRGKTELLVLTVPALELLIHPEALFFPIWLLGAGVIALYWLVWLSRRARD